ncbi:unnamed protein product [Blepharisma stoltei]|uniref:Ferritin-like diiron domain-containing protein n=1 Tax=Blepharisma stoltei TaxID=1481888 RepID=A0AAU9JE18_9CILI|nr:unnamed protein product [Blepharisma stoltei]
MAAFPTNLRDALIIQAQKESDAYLLYMQGSAWFGVRHLTGIAKKLRSEANDERTHFESIIDYLTLRDQHIHLVGSQMMELNWSDEASVFEFFLNLERGNTKSISEVYALARQVGEYDTEKFLSDMLSKQIQSTNEWEGLFERLKSFTQLPGLIWHLDSLF